MALSTEKVTNKKRKIPFGFGISWMALLALWLVYAMNANMRNFFFTVQPSIVKEFHLTPSALGMFTAFVTLAQSVLVLPISRWSDKGIHGWGRKFREVPIAIGYTIFSIFTGIGALTHSIFSVFILQAVKNMFGGAGESVEVTTVAEWWPVERRGFAQGAHHTGYPWGTLIGGFAVSGILATFGPQNWRLVFLILPLATLPILVIYWVFSTKRRYEKVSSQFETYNLTSPLAGGFDKESTHRAPAGALKRALKNPNVLVPAICSGLGLAVYTGLGFWLTPYLAFVAHYNFAQAAAYSVIFTITGGLGQIFWGFMSDKFGRKFVLIFCFLWLTAAMILLQFTRIDLAWLIFVQLFAGVATNGIYPVLYALSSDSAEKGSLAVGNGLNMVGQGIGGMSPLVLGPLIGLGGGFASATGYVYGLYFLSGLMFIAAILMAFFTRETIGKFKKADKALVRVESCNIPK
ncbi:MFS transporter [Alicyclobacillus fastidiosus]|uniref:MFS transporter n=1 Tax=Alicyclobacillus fastidiosus TaxID=392011 RepID=A0ABY6ZHU5_9BACL|nr:MFS transporter [Alicyclobacillus fastidiosus]WAH41796.1 MFS transporter [Alicyclobacillus fastidiosus]GMA63492.1 MFS transporter [Alicyclobacillus fastidiosus]